MFEIADLKSETIAVIGKGEAQISNVMESRRKYEYLDRKMDVINMPNSIGKSVNSVSEFVNI